MKRIVIELADYTDVREALDIRSELLRIGLIPESITLEGYEAHAPSLDYLEVKHAS